MYSKASHFRVAQRTSGVVEAPDPLISLNINSCLHALFISSVFFVLVLIRLRDHLATAKLGST